MFEKDRLDVKDFRIFVYDAASNGSQIQVRNLVADINNIKKKFVEEAVDINEEMGEMAKDLTENSSCF